MTTSMIGLAFSLVWFVFAVPTAIFLLRAYGRSKMSGFIWLLMGLVVWPFLAQGARIAMPMLASGMGYGFNPILILNFGLSMVGALLVLVAVIILDRELGQRLVATQPVQPALAPAPPPTDLH